MTVILVVLVGLALAWLVAAARRYAQMVDFRRNVRADADAFIARARASGDLDYPPAWLREDRRDRGIVMCAGGPSLLTQAWTNLEVLRNHLGSTLPVALYYVGRGEMPEACERFFLESFDGLSCIDATEVPDRPHQPARKTLEGFEIKPFTLLNAPFDELIFIDADSLALRDPAALFESPRYAEHGNLFWPDAAMLSTLVPHPDAFGVHSLRDGRQRSHIQTVNPRIFDHLGLPRPSSPARADFETESGQIVLDRRRCMDAIQTTWFLCSRGRHIQLYSYGDTLMYRLAWGVVGRPFCQMPHPSHHAGVVADGVFSGRAVVQRDDAGEPFFLHQMHRKPDVGRPWEPITHVTSALAVDHPKPRSARNVTMQAAVARLDDLRPIDGDLAKVEERVRAAWEELKGRAAEAHLPAPRPRPLLSRRILPW